MNTLVHTPPPHTSLWIADYILAHAQKPLTSIEINKLVYLAHGWYLGFKGTPLILDTIEAWEHGPVIPTLLYTFRRYGNNQIDTLELCQTKIRSDDLHEQEKFEVRKKELFSRFSNDENVIMDSVIEKWEKHSENELLGHTSSKEDPWYEIYYEKNEELINNYILKNHYKAALTN